MSYLDTIVDANIGNMLNSFRNKQHRETAAEYNFIRKRIDKVKVRTRRNDIQALLALDHFLKDKSYKNATQDDMLHFEAYLENEYRSNRRHRTKKKKKGLNKSTIEQYEAHIKRFYKFIIDPTNYKKGKRFQKNIPYPNNVSWISANSNNHNQLPLDNLLNEKQVLTLLNACTTPRDAAMIAAGFYDAGLRIGELISLNVNSVGFDKLGGYFILPKEGKDLKTGTRKVRLFIMPSSTQYLKEFVNKHPFKKYDNAPLFYSLDGRKYYRVLKKTNAGTVSKKELEEIRLSRPGIEENLRKLCNLTGLPVITPHKLRHNSCTLAAKVGFNEMELRIRYGWSPTSKMPSRYTHLASKDLDDKIKIITGYKEPEEMKPSELVSVECWNCQEENVPTNKFCSRCGSKLNPDKQEMAPSAKDIGLETQEMLKDKEFREFYNEMLAQTYHKYKQRKEKETD